MITLDAGLTAEVNTGTGDMRIRKPPTYNFGAVKIAEPHYKVWPVDMSTYNTFAEIGGEFRGGEVVEGTCDDWSDRNQLLIVTYHE